MPWRTYNIWKCVSSTENGAKIRKKKLTVPSCIPLVFVCLSEVRIYLLMSSIHAAKSGSWHRLEELFLSESHFTAEQVRTKCRVDA